VRDQRAAPQLGDALRITVGSPAQNDRVIAALNEDAAGGASAPTATVTIVGAEAPPTETLS
jgi:histidinol phosphate aminotransferase apoenzyme (EC 2.6.1.9)